MTLPAIGFNRRTGAKITVPQIRGRALITGVRGHTETVGKVHALIEKAGTLLAIRIEDVGVLLEFRTQIEGRIKRCALRIIAEEISRNGTGKL